MSSPSLPRRLGPKCIRFCDCNKFFSLENRNSVITVYG